MNSLTAIVDAGTEFTIEHKPSVFGSHQPLFHGEVEVVLGHPISLVNAPILRNTTKALIETIEVGDYLAISRYRDILRRKKYIITLSSRNADFYSDDFFCSVDSSDDFKYDSMCVYIDGIPYKRSFLLTDSEKIAFNAFELIDSNIKTSESLRLL